MPLKLDAMADAAAAKKPRIVLDKRMFCDNVDRFCKHFKVRRQAGGHRA